ncbi:hypothetical protein LguiA_017448 [Lonicera macranthoides]
MEKIMKTESRPLFLFLLFVLLFGPTEGKQNETHFVLVHGSCHGAWCWYKLANLLKLMGHKVTAMDLAASGINTKQVADLKDVNDYMEPLMEFMSGLPAEDKVVLVGHSMGGVAISAAMEKFPQKIVVAVFVTAFMPGPKLSMFQIDEFRSNLPGNASTDIQYGYDDGTSNFPTSFLFGHKYMQTTMYQNSPKEDLELAFTLVRPYPNFPDAKSAEEASVTEENYGTVRRVYIMSGQDKGMVVPLQMYMMVNNPPDEVKEICDSDHMVMFSKPNELCLHLLEIAAKYNIIDD